MVENKVLLVADSLRVRAWSNVLRLAINFPDKESIKKLVSAALADGWDMNNVMVERGGSHAEQEASLPDFASWSYGLPGESSPLVDALSELGVDWCQSHSKNQQSFIEKAINFGNWSALRSMGDSGSSFLGGVEGDASPGLSPVSKLWQRFDQDYLFAPIAASQEQKRNSSGLVKVAALGVAASISKVQLEAAFASGEADPKRWLPALAISFHQSVILGSAEPKNDQRSMEAFLAWGRSCGCDHWSESVNGSCALEQIDMVQIQRPTMAFWLAFHAIEAPTSWRVALRDADLGVEIDARSMWAVGQSIKRSCLEASSWDDLAASGVSVAEALKLLSPWAPEIVLASALPVMKYHQTGDVDEQKDLEVTVKEGWGAACALMCSGSSPGLADVRVSKSKNSTAYTELNNALELAVSNTVSAVEWAGLNAQSVEWNDFVHEFSNSFASNVALAAVKIARRMKISSRGQRVVSGAIPEVARCAIAVLGRLSKALGAHGPELTDRCLGQLGVAFKEEFTRFPIQADWEPGLADLAAALLDANWSSPAKVPGAAVFLSLCAEAADSLSKNDSTDKARSKNIAVLESWVLRETTDSTKLAPSKSMRM